MLPHHNITARVSDCSSSCAGNTLENYFSFDSTKNEILSKRKKFEKEWVDIPLELPAISLAQAKKDFRRQKTILNGVQFTPELHSTNNNDLFASSLYTLCEMLSRICPLPTKSTEIAESIMQRSCRSGTGADSFFAVHQLFSVQDTIVTQHEHELEATINISLFSSRGSLWARCDCKNSYALVDTSQLGEESGEETANGIPSPWLYVDTYIRDDTNFNTGFHTRALTIVTSRHHMAERSLHPQTSMAARRRRSSGTISIASDLGSEHDAQSVYSHSSKAAGVVVCKSALLESAKKLERQSPSL